MHPTRAPKPADGSPAVTEERGGDPAPGGAAAAPAPTSTPTPTPTKTPCGRPANARRTRSSGGGETHKSGRGNVTFRSEPPAAGHPCASSEPPYRRSSSGYFSYEGSGSVPSSPLSPVPATADKATQTPSPAAQALTHARLSLLEASPGAPVTHHGSPPSPSSTRQHQAAEVMQEVEIGRRLQRIGDDFNEHISRRVPPRHELPPFHQEPVVFICLGLLLFAIGRYLQGSVNGHSGHS